MSRTRRSVCVSVAVFTVLAALFLSLSAAKAQPTDDPAKLWNEFNHWVRMAKPELAKDYWQKLAPMVSDAALLDIAEASHYHKDFELTMKLARGNPTLQDVAKEIDKRLTDALIARSRDRERIEAAINKLDDGERSNFNARKLLSEAGQFAVPQMLQALQDPDREALRSYILDAFIDVDRDAVYPLSVALPYLEPVPQGQIAQVLAQLGYPSALPALKQVIEAPGTDAHARELAQTAYAMVAKNAAVSPEASAASLYLARARHMYRLGTLGREVEGFDQKRNVGIVWSYDRVAGLINVPVPAAIHPDVRVMRATRTSLQLDPDVDESASLFLAANSRRGLRLPEGESDPSYKLPHGPDFYLRLAGPIRQHDVLALALKANDIPLARFAIAALADTGGIKALLNLDGDIQPLLAAMNHPNRMVRIEAIQAVAQVQPQESFPGSQRVVPVLAEAVRQTGAKYALVITTEPNRQKELQGHLEGKGYDVVFGANLEAVQERIAVLPGIDLLVVDGSMSAINNVFARTIEDYRLASVPVVAVAPSDADIVFRRYQETDRLIRADAWRGTEALDAAVKKAEDYAASGEVPQELATQYALDSLVLLLEIARTNSPVFDVSEAQPALISALNDRRPDVVMGAGDVLAQLDSEQAQRELANAALRDGINDQVRISLLGSLAESANLHGSMLPDAQLKRLMSLVKTSSGPVAVEAARAVGAHLPATRELIDMITVEK